ncbi:MAG TPA: hypothetical protein PLH94_08335 [Fimbriimonadaceae bacterium]|nr:hypothetical protein [Fimbriimonadaceae bacterium]
MKVKRTLGILAAATAILVLPASALLQGVKIAWNPKAGSTSKFMMNVDAEGDFGQGAMKIKVSMKVANKVKSVSDKEIVIESTMSDMKIKMGDDGQEMADPSGQGDQTTTNTYSRNGALVSTKSAAGMDNPRMEQMSSFLYPDKEIAIGGSWDRDLAKDDKKGTPSAKGSYTLVGEDKLGKWTAYKVTWTYKETSGDRPSSAEGTAWLDKETGEVIKLEAKMKDVVFQEGIPPMNANVTMTRTE